MRPALRALFATLVVALAAAPAPGQETGEAAPAKPAGVIKLEIVEKVEGKPSRDTPAIYRIRQKLREFGFVAWTEKPLRADEYEKKKREKESTKGAPAGATATAAAGEEKPAPDLIIRGIVDVSLGKTSTFYGQSVAYAYDGVADLTIVDARTGKELAVVAERDEWGKTEQKAAREESHKRITAWTTAAVLKAEPIYGRLGPNRQKAVDAYHAQVAEKRKATSAGEDDDPKQEDPKK